MRSNIVLKWPLNAVDIAAMMFFSMFLFFVFFPVHRAVADSEPGLPVYLRIPEIGVDAPIDSVGLTPEGALGVPKGPVTSAWFDLGPRPGENGSAVIDGHFGWKDGIPAVFDNLSKLHKGDIVYVEDTTGSTTAFVVRDIKTYGQNEDASDVFASSDGKAHLNLITCEGVWNNIQKSYSNRLVVFTDKE
jgi:LPXTG-site transpeptidase (sortase) family protein